MQQKARINISSIDIDKINQVTEAIMNIAKKMKVPVSGPIPLPTKKLKHTVRKSPCGDGRVTWERYEMRVHKRLIDLGINERALRLVMRIPIPENLQIQIEMMGQ